jgi:hypothetical protein
MIYALTLWILYGVLGIALSSLNTSNKWTLRRPGYWVAVLCVLGIQLASRFM